MTHGHLKTVSVANEMVFLGAIVVPENLFVQIAEQMERFNVDVCSLESALEEAPEVFESVGVNLPINVTFCMVNRLVQEVWPQSLIGHERIGVDGAFCFNVSANTRLQVMLPAGRDDVGANLAATLQNPHDSGLAFNASVGDFLAALVGVHESRCAADESLVHFDFFTAPADPYGVLLMQGEPNAVHHKPRGLLSDSQSAGHFIGTDSVLSVHDEPNGNHPLVHAERRVLEDRTNLDRELFLAALAEPITARRDKRVFRSFATWARYLAVRPAQLYSIVKHALRVREESDCFLQRLGKLECVCHV